jgi:hypothetical protein
MVASAPDHTDNQMPIRTSGSSGGVSTSLCFDGSMGRWVACKDSKNVRSVMSAARQLSIVALTDLVRARSSKPSSSLESASPTCQTVHYNEQIRVSFSFSTVVGVGSVKATF